MTEIRQKTNAVLTYIKQHWAILLILGLGLYFFTKSLTRTVEETKIAKSDTTRITTQITQPIVYEKSYTPFLFKDTVKQVVVIPPQYQPSEDIAQLKQQVTELGNKFFRYNRSRDTIYLHDTSGLVVGNVNIEDSITENMIARRNVNYQLKFPKEIVTITNTLAPEKRTQVFLGPEVSLKQSNLFNQAGLAALLKTKDDKIFKIGFGAQFTTPLQPYISAGYYPLISFRKKKQ